MRSLKPFCNLIAAVTAASVGLVTLVSLFAPTVWPEILGALLLQVVVVTSAIAILIGLLNLMTVHLRRIFQFRRGGLSSLVILASAAGVMVVRLLDLRTTDTDEAISLALFESIQLALESALAGLMFFFLVYAAYRMLRGRVTWNGCLFISVIFVVLLGWLPLQGLDLLSNLRDWVLQIPATAGMRGLLIGIALGTITVGLRVLIGQEQAFREK